MFLCFPFVAGSRKEAVCQINSVNGNVTDTLSLGFSPSFHTLHSTYISKGTGIAKRNEQHAGTMKPEFGSLQPTKGWEPGGAAFTGRQTE